MSVPPSSSTDRAEEVSENMNSSPPQIRFVPHVTSYARSLHFDVLDRDVPKGRILKVGRYTDKVQPSPARIAFKSKVVSRAHAEIWTEDGQFFLRDTKSSSGTFLNQQRLSPPNQESAPHLLKDGDILQLGVDYQGGTQDVFRCVKIRLEINRSWQREQQNPFRLKALQTLEALKKNLRAGISSSDTSQAMEECCICLCSLAAFQALFVAPCSHTFHYKCIRRLLLEGPSFVCPLCRTYADLEADVCNEEEISALDSKLEGLGLAASSHPLPGNEKPDQPAPHPLPPTIQTPSSEQPPRVAPTSDEEGFPSEHQECRTPANPTPHLLFNSIANASSPSGLAPTRSLSAALPTPPPTSSDTNTPASIRSPPLRGS